MSVALQKTVLIYVYEGELAIGEAADSLQAGQMGMLRHGNHLHLVAPHQTSRFLVLAALPIKEPIVQSGPFVMNSVEEIEQAFRDYHNGVLTLTEENIMQTKLATTSVDIHDIIQARWSPRAFDANQSVSHDDLLALLEAARWAASCFNDQPWRFVVCDKNTDADSWQQAFSILVERNQLWAKNAPVLLLAVAMTHFNHNDHPNRWAEYDTGAAVANLSLQATALGLVVHQMGGFDAEQASELFHLPPDCTPMAMIAIGYQAKVGVLDDDFKAAELAERSRAALHERFYAGRWGKDIE
jgi:nitroreductase